MASRILLLLAGLVATLGLATGAGAAGSELDSTFGENGIAQFPTQDEFATGVIALPDGSTVAVGQSDDASVVVRLTSDGVPQPGFGQQGRAGLDLSTGWDWLEDVAALGSDVVVAGSDGQHALLARVDAGGSLVPGFGTGGAVVTPYGSFDFYTTVAVDGSGRILAGGYRDGGGVVARFLPNGSPDVSFGGGDGITTTAYEVRAVAALANGSIVVGGTQNAFPADLVVSRLDASGAVDSAFGTGGVRTAGTAAHDAAVGIATHPDGSVTIGGSAGGSLVLVSVDSTGDLVGGFGSGGVAVISAASQLAGTDLVAAGAGRVAVVGSDATLGSALVALVDDQGGLVADFGQSGIVHTDIGPDTDGWDGAAVSGDRLVTAGWAGNRLALARYVLPAGAGSEVDLTAPVIVQPSDLTVEATSAAGAVVVYQAPAVSDDTDLAPSIACAPGSGTAFAFGTTTVTCTASDVSGNSAAVTFSVIVDDTIAPRLELPGTIVVSTTGSRAAAAYAVSATDVVDPSPSISCAPPSGSWFALGTTSVGCAATDDRGNTSSGTFTVRVVGAVSLLRDLRGLVQNRVGRPAKVQLLHKLDQLEEALERGRTRQACRKLEQFVRAAKHERMTAAARDDVLVAADRLGPLLRCG